MNVLLFPFMCRPSIYGHNWLQNLYCICHSLDIWHIFVLYTFIQKCFVLAFFLDYIMAEFSTCNMYMCICMCIYFIPHGIYYVDPYIKAHGVDDDGVQRVAYYCCD